jgi:hypothetical protein
MRLVFGARVGGVGLFRQKGAPGDRKTNEKRRRKKEVKAGEGGDQTEDPKLRMAPIMYSYPSVPKHRRFMATVCEGTARRRVGRDKCGVMNRGCVRDRAIMIVR